MDSSVIDDDCEQNCFEMSDCILAFYNEQDYCIQFIFGSTETLQVEEATREEGLYVSFKTTLPDNTCPAYENLLPVVKRPDEEDIFWTKSGTIWTFRKCVGDWKMIRRSNPEITVCMQVFRTATDITRVDAIDYCESRGFKLTGAANSGETDTIMRSLKDANGGVLENRNAVWIDGKRNCTGRDSSCRVSCPLEIP